MFVTRRSNSSISSVFIYLFLLQTTKSTDSTTINSYLHWRSHGRGPPGMGGGPNLIFLLGLVMEFVQFVEQFRVVRSIMKLRKMHEN